MNLDNNTLIRMHPYHTPNNERLTTMDLWKASSLCVGLTVLVIPLMVIPGILAASLRTYHPIPDPVDYATIGIVFALCVFVGVSKLLRVPLSDIFVRRPDRSVVRWGLFGLSLATIVCVPTIVVLEGSFTVMNDGLEDIVHIVIFAAMIGAWTGILEEILIRGYLLSIIGHQWNWTAAILVTSIIFGLLHNAHVSNTAGQLLYIVFTGVAGVTFALITLYTGNVWNAVVIHAVWNALFSDYFLVFQAPTATGTEALVTYVPLEVPLLFGGEIAYVTESPFSILVFTFAAVAVYWYHQRVIP